MNNNTDEGVRLLKHKMSFGRVLFSWTGIILILLIIFVSLFLVAISYFAKWLTGIAAGVFIFDLLVVIYLVNSNMDSSAKITWLLVITAIPVVGACLYLFSRLSIGSRTLRKATEDQQYMTRDSLGNHDAELAELAKQDTQAAGTAAYIQSTGNYPVWMHNDVKYYSLGEYKWEALLEDLRAAKEFIFMEYFIIDEGLMWGKMLEIMKQKAAEGVEIRVLYDGTNEFNTLPRNYPEKLKEIGIQCKIFSPLIPVVSTHYNYRDHRKILVIDGKVAYNGGVNLADEYINAIVKYGHWKDTAIRIAGPAVDSFTVMFLEMWNLLEEKPDVEKYIGKYDTYDSKGFVIPFGDNPFDKHKVGETVYMDILYQAKQYVHIMSPYLILDDEMIAALCSTALRGVDVKLIVPGMYDKQVVGELGETYYERLIQSGVEVYAYTPGFIHAKMFISDDIKAVVGTINLDYRSLYHHFECGTYMYDTECIKDIKADFEDTIAKCHKVSLEEAKKTKAAGHVARLLAPMM